MIVGTSAKRHLDLLSQPKASLILHGLKDSSSRVKLLKGGNSFASALQKSQSPKIADGKASMIFVNKKFSLPYTSEEGLEAMTEKYKQSLVEKFERSCEDVLVMNARLAALQKFQDLESSRVLNKKKKDPSVEHTERKIQNSAKIQFAAVEDLEMRDFLINCHALSLRDQYKNRLNRKLEEVNEVKERLLSEQFKKKNHSTERKEAFISSKRKNMPNFIFKWHANTGRIGSDLHRPLLDKPLQRALTETVSKDNDSRKKQVISPRNVIVSLPSKTDLRTEEDEQLLLPLRKIAKFDPTKATGPTLKPRNFSLTKLFKKEKEISIKPINSKLEVRRLGDKRYQIRNIEEEKIRQMVKNCVKSKKSDDQLMQKFCEI